MIAVLISLVGSYASLLALYLTIRPEETTRSEWEIGGLIVATALLATGAVAEVRRHMRNRPRRYRKDSPRIGTYLANWLATGGRCAIFTRDMTWASSSEMSALLKRKARAGELTVFMPKPTPLAEELRSLGASIISYEALGLQPRARFTIAHWQRDGSRIAVGRPVGDQHTIQEYSEGEHPIFAVAQDLIDVITRSQQTSDTNQSQ